MARLGIEPRSHGYIPGALPLSYLALGNHMWTASLCHLTNCGQIADPTTPQQFLRKDSRLWLGTVPTASMISLISEAE